MTPEQYADNSIYGFLEHYQVTNDQGVPLDFSNHSFMWDIYGDWSPQIVGLKAAQVTWSTCFSIKTLYVAKTMGLDIIYSLPTSDDVREFVSGKVNRLITNNHIFQKWTEDKDSIEQKRIGANNIYYRGTWTERAALMIPADLYVSDETDRSKQDTVRQFETRLQHSKWAWVWKFSNPSAPGVGVDKMWVESDMKHWFVKCEHCNYEWYITMENLMGAPTAKAGVPPYFGCIKCKKELNRRKGRWVKKHLDKAISGYWVSLLMCPWVSAQTVLDRKKGYSEEQFTNFVLGQPYVGKGNVLTQQMLFQNLTDKVNAQDSRPIIGVDTGIDIRYTVGNKYGLFYYGECKDYSELEKLLQRWPDAIMVIDQGGDIIGPRKLREKYQNRVFLCFFRQDRKNDQLITWNYDDGTVVADRNKCIQLVVDEFTERRIPIAGGQAEWWDYWLHWSHIYRIEEYNENTGETKFKWMRSDRDDWALATVYWRIGIDRFMESYATFAEPKAALEGIGLEVLPDGSTPVTMFRPKFRLG
jgi:hypothetical protein